MEMFYGIVIFILGFALGVVSIWMARKAHIGVLDEKYEHMFGDLSRQALLENQRSFLDVAKITFEALSKKTEEQLGKKSEDTPIQPKEAWIMF